MGLTFCPTLIYDKAFPPPTPDDWNASRWSSQDGHHISSMRTTSRATQLTLIHIIQNSFAILDKRRSSI